MKTSPVALSEKKRIFAKKISFFALKINIFFKISRGEMTVPPYSSRGSDSENFLTYFSEVQ